MNIEQLELILNMVEGVADNAIIVAIMYFTIPLLESMLFWVGLCLLTYIGIKQSSKFFTKEIELNSPMHLVQHTIEDSGFKQGDYIKGKGFVKSCSNYEYFENVVALSSGKCFVPEKDKTYNVYRKIEE